MRCRFQWHIVEMYEINLSRVVSLDNSLDYSLDDSPNDSFDHASYVSLNMSPLGSTTLD